jgi:hypothetical protein
LRLGSGEQVQTLVSGICKPFAKRQSKYNQLILIVTVGL